MSHFGWGTASVSNSLSLSLLLIFCQLQNITGIGFCAFHLLISFFYLTLSSPCAYPCVQDNSYTERQSTSKILPLFIADLYVPQFPSQLVNLPFCFVGHAWTHTFIPKFSYAYAMRDGYKLMLEARMNSSRALVSYKRWSLPLQWLNYIVEY